MIWDEIDVPRSRYPAPLGPVLRESLTVDVRTVYARRDGIRCAIAGEYDQLVGTYDIV